MQVYLSAVHAPGLSGIHLLKRPALSREAHVDWPFRCLTLRI